MSFPFSNPVTAADSWLYNVGTQVFGRNGKIPTIRYKPLRNKQISEELHNQQKAEGKFNENICCLIGKISGHTPILNYARKGLYLNMADIDNLLGLKELCNYKGHQFTLEEFAQLVFVSQHADDKTHAHIFWLSSKPMAKRTLDKDRKILELIKNNQIPAIEFKAQGDIGFCSGGFHERGTQYLPIGTHEIFVIEELGGHIHNICRKYELPVSDSERNKIRIARKNAISDEGSDMSLTDYPDDYEPEEWTDITEGSRNEILFDRARRYYRKNKDKLTDNSFRRIIHYKNQRYCKPPLDTFEVDAICSSILNHNNNGASA